MRRNELSFTGLVSALFLVFSNVSWAVSTIRQVQVSGGSQIDLLFDSKIKKTQVKTDFFNDTIQLTLSDVSVYPAKISSVSGAALSKVFTYQYAPKVVRCRLTVKGNAEDYKGKLKLDYDGKVLSVRLADGMTDKLSTQAAKSEDAGRRGDKNADQNFNEEEQAILDRVLKVDVKPDFKAPLAKAESAEKLDKSEKQERVTSSGSAVAANAPASSRVLRSSFGVATKLLLVLGLFGTGALFLRRWMQGMNRNQSGFSGSLNRFLKKNFGTKGQLIEVLATHYLGPKKSIAVVKVSGRALVLGVTDDSVNLITEMSASDYERTNANEEDELTGNSEIDEEMKRLGPITRQDRPLNSQMLNTQGKTERALDPFESALLSAGGGVKDQVDIRSRIRTKLEGLKPL